MSLTINDTTMTSDHSGYTARRALFRNDWEASWLPGQILDRTNATTAMTLAAAEAIARASQPPASATPRKDAFAERADPEAGS
jgi:hypothetical protein